MPEIAATATTTGTIDTTVVDRAKANLRKAWRVLASPRLAVVLLGIIAVVSVIGTILPQTEGSEKIMRAAQERYGPHLHKIFKGLGFYQLYQSWWFVSLLAVFTVNNLACLALRTRMRLKSLGFILTHFSIACIAAGVIVGAVWGEKGYVRIHENQAVSAFRSRDDETVKLGFQVRLDNFTLERHGELVEAVRVWDKDRELVAEFPAEVGASFHVPDTDYHFTVLRYEPDFYIDLKTRKVASKSAEPNNPALLLGIAKGSQKRASWLFSRFPGQRFDKHGDASLRPIFVREQEGPVKDYKSKLTVLDGDKEVLQKTIVVNKPLTYGGYTFYQSSYDQEQLHWTGLQVTKDPGVPLVYVGFLLMVIGITFIYCVKPLLKTAPVRA